MNRMRDEELGGGNIENSRTSSSANDNNKSASYRGKSRHGHRQLHSAIDILLSRSFVLDQIFLFLEGSVGLRVPVQVHV